MSILKRIFSKKETWTELETLYTLERLEYIRTVLTEAGIPYKVRAALLPIASSTAAPLGTAAQSLWYLSVHPDDVGKVHQYLRQERMG